MLKGTAAASLRHRNRAATTVLVCEQTLSGMIFVVAMKAQVEAFIRL